MRKLALLLLFLMSFIPTAKAQSVLVGASGTLAYANADAAITAGIELPYHRFEIDLYESYSPFAKHINLGTGHANIASITPTIWFGKTGIQGSLTQSSYAVTSVRKSAIYASGGINRKAYIGVPAQIGFGYIQQVNNGILNGVETSQLHGGYISFDFRVGCAGKICFRVQDQFSVGRVLQQGNPYCDGTIGPKTCGNRNSAIGAGGTLNILIEFPRYRGHEDELF